ncbi:type I CRISPR-associated protein Cas7 [Candidatus Micrarchaeota archaeon]|nr:type I CRISPR-associated protein Cas7 [Candidatus Micrarchaeota archaeon]
MTGNYEKFGYGVFLLKTKNSLFNANFAHEPRQLPDEYGTFYATDKSLKYCIRRYIHDIKGDKNVFFWRRNDDKLNALTLGGNYKSVFGKGPVKKDSLGAETNLLSCWDVRAFGATFAESECSVSITGPIQITYGVNKAQENQKYSNQILSPFLNSNKKEKDAARTLGNESKAQEAHLAFDYVINPKTLRQPKLTNEDVVWFKEALCKGVSYVNSSAKIGSESEFMLYVESDEHNTLPLMKDLLDIRVEHGMTMVGLKRVANMLSEYGIKNIEVYYEPSFVTLEGLPAGAKTFNIHTLSSIG